MPVGIGRRELMAVLGGMAAWPVAAAQQGKRPIRIGFLFVGSPSNAYDRSLVEAFRQGLRQVGLVENQDIVLDIVQGGNPDQQVSAVLQRGAELLVPTGSSFSVAAKNQTTTVPIVFINVGNPVAMGLVESLPHPVRNATGFSDMLGDLSGKLVDLAKELSKPQLTVDYLWHTAWPDGDNRYRATEEAAHTAGVKLRSHGIADIAELDDAIAGMKQSRATTVVVQPSPLTYGERGRIIDAALKHRLGTVFAFPAAAREGALIAYGPDYVHMYRRAPLYVDRVLKGTKPADLPVEQPARIEMLVNLTTAKTLGVEVPLPLLIRADDLIE
jgi:putative tryptophan/tyrosine transport system substrate-binding protein